MSDGQSPEERVRPLLRVRQYRDFTAEPVAPDALGAVADAARWSGSSSNSQPWRFLVVTDRDTIGRIAAIGLPQTHTLETAPSAIAIALPDETDRAVSRAYDEGRAAERMLIAASMLNLGAGIAWIRPEFKAAVRELLGVPDGWFVRTIVAVGHPTEAARRPKAAPGTARLPREQVVFTGRWPER